MTMLRPTTSPAMSPMAAYVTRIFFFARGTGVTLRTWLFFNAAVRAGRVVVWLRGSGLLKVGQRVRRTGSFRSELVELRLLRG